MSCPVTAPVHLLSGINSVSHYNIERSSSPPPPVTMFINGIKCNQIPLMYADMTDIGEESPL